MEVEGISTAITSISHIDQVVENIFGAATDKGDLAIEVKNNSNEYIYIDYYTDIGEIQRVAPLKGNTISFNELWRAGVYAGSQGASIHLNLSMPGGSITIVISNPQNNRSYYKLPSSQNKYSLGREEEYSVNHNSLFYSNNNSTRHHCQDKCITITLQQEKLSACLITIE